MSDGWAWVSLSAFSEDLSSDQIQALLPGSDASRGNPHMASVRFKGSHSGVSLEALLRQLADYLREYGQELRSRLAQADFQLRIGWSPHSPQECIAISATLLSALAEISADLMLDIYDDNEGDVSEGGTA